MFFSARQLANLDVLTDSDPQLFLYLREGNDKEEKLIGKTEVRKNNLNPDWKVLKYKSLLDIYCSKFYFWNQLTLENCSYG